jgi:endonuclease/exonuclease/phosphatase (EEP) superfamily protein YafD
VLSEGVTKLSTNPHEHTEKNIQQGFSVIHQNVCSVLSKMDQIESLLLEEDPDCLILTEHFLRASEAATLRINHLQYISSFCRPSIKGGGVVILGRDSLCVGEVHIPDGICVDKDFEAAVIRISFSFSECKSIFLIGIYRSPSGNFSSFMERLDTLLNFIRCPDSSYILMGDFNVDSLISSNRLTELSSLMSSFGLKMLTTNVPTRIQGSSISAIDHVITDLGTDCCSVSMLNHAISDHYGQKILVNRRKQINRYPVMKRNLSKNNLNILSHRLSSVNWDRICSGRSLEGMITLFTDTLVINLDLVCPITCHRVNTRPKPDWLTRGLKISGHKLKEMFFIYRTTSNIEFKTYYRRYKQIYQKLIRVAKGGCISRKIMTSNNISSTAWKIINSVRCNKKNKSDHGPLKLNVNSNTVTNPDDIVNILNGRFINVRDYFGIPHAKPLARQFNDLESSISEFPKVSEEEVEAVLNDLKTSSSAGPDGIPPCVLKHSSKVLAKPLSIILNESYSTGRFPEQLKTARVIPVFKKGSRTDPTCYRPISILSAISKVFERQAYKVLAGHLDKNKILACTQYGFRKDKSTTLAATDLVEYLLDCLEGGKKVVGTFLDLSQAFDSVDHTVLLQVLEKYGIRDRVLTWLETFIRDRHQFVQILFPYEAGAKVYRSKIDRMVSGVPQGSVLGPLLFLLYVNELSKTTSGKVIQYADDTSLINTDDNMQLVEISNFIATNLLSQEINNLGLMLNETKTTFLSFSLSRQTDPALSLMVNNTSVEVSYSTKFMGILLDSRLNWSSHVDKVCHEVSSGIFVLRRLSMYCGKPVLKSVYYALIYSRLSYGVMLWGASTIGNMERVLRVQKRAIRCMARLRNRDSCRESYRRLEVLTFPAIYIFETIKFALTRVTINELVVARDHPYNTRSNGELTLPLPRVRLEISKKKPSYAGIKLFNNLPGHLRRIVGDRKMFYRSLRTYLLEACPYDLENYTR